MTRPANQFLRGQSVYTCRCCSRQTRQTGRGDNDGIELCAECYDLSGWENQFMDGRQPDDVSDDELRQMAETYNALLAKAPPALRPTIEKAWLGVFKAFGLEEVA